MTTETGVTLEEPISEQVQALLYLSVYLDQFKRGWKHTANPGVEYLIYQPRSGEAFSVQLQTGKYRCEWFDPAKGLATGESRIEVLAGSQAFAAPTDGEVALYLKAQ